jgi:hypothetical protein
MSRALFESALIVFSVLLALAVNEWADQRRQASHARVALAAIVSEVQANRASLVAASAFHRKIQGILEQFQAAGREPDEQTATGGLFQPARLVTTAWQSARDSGATSQLPYPLVLELSRLYQSKDRYNDLAQQLTNDLYADLRRRGLDAVLRQGYRGMLILVIDFSNRERRLVEAIDATLATVEQRR